MVIADTGFWLALHDRDDRHHRRARSCLAALDERLITTWPVVTEAAFLLLDRMRPESGVTFLRDLDGACDLYDLPPGSPLQLAELMERYADQPMDLADASLAVLAEHLGHGRILTTDRRDFAVYRWRRREPFRNLLFEG
jgi:hypothetical protein